jgi:hypothetical protein
LNKSGADAQLENISHQEELKANNSFDQKVDFEEEEIACQEEQLPELKEIEPYYKYANPMNVIELEWKVTLSMDFPWQEICFEPYSAKECYKMYT